jgi:hypothetical protein
LRAVEFAAATRAWKLMSFATLQVTDLHTIVVCRALQQYKLCVAPVERMCPLGVQSIYAVSSEWNKNMQLAIYTCDAALTGNNHISLLYRYTRSTPTCLSQIVALRSNHSADTGEMETVN